MDSQPELLAQHYAEAGLVAKSVACWGKAGHRSAARPAMAEAAAQFHKGLDQLALLPEDLEHQRLNSILERLGRGLAGRQRRRSEARDRLAPVYGWFTGGFDTADLKETKALLDELA
jgi:predicted ATPase